MLLEQAGESLGLIDADLILEEIYRRYRPVVLWIAANNSSSTSSQMGMKTVPK
jgi:hypothetical protein